jgi:hypothetical protein
VPAAGTLIAAWEAGAQRPAPARAPSLLTTLGLLPDGVRSDELTVGECDARLFRLRRSIFGEDLEANATCPSCGDDVEFTLSLAALQPATDDPRDRATTVEAAGFRVLCRPLRNVELEALALLDGADQADVLERCVIDARSETGASIDGRSLPAAVGAEVLRVCADQDPGAQTVVGLRCPCGGEWAEELDIRSILWTDLSEWVQRTLEEVHGLARFYGWSEAEILSLSTWRRRWYLEASGW